MFNEKTKTQFIKESKLTSVRMADAYEQAFNALAKYENGWNADFVTRSVEDLRPVLEDVVGFGKRSRWHRIGIYEDYSKWCQERDIPGVTNSITVIKAEVLDESRQQTVVNPTQLLKYLDNVFDVTDSSTSHIPLRCYLWMSFSGIPEKDIIQITKDDVDFSNMEIRFGGNEYPIYRESIRDFRAACELTEFRYIHPNYVEKTVVRSRAPGRCIMRGFRGVLTVASLKAKVSELGKKANDSGNTNMRLSYTGIALSGLFYRIYEQERAGIPIDFESVAIDYMGDTVYKLDLGRNKQDAMRRRIASFYWNDYLKWKDTFNEK